MPDMPPIPVMETFYSVQGEGYHQGSPAYFIRLARCDVGCHWCDVKESWDKDAHPLRSVEELVERASACGAEKIIITGGEPAMYDLRELTKQLHHAKLKTHIETSGVYVLTGEWDWICFSPKKYKEPHPSIYETAHELKAIIYNTSDFLFAEKEASKLTHDCLLYLQPEWSRAAEMLPLIVAYIKTHTQWKISIQMHKYIGVE